MAFQRLHCVELATEDVAFPVIPIICTVDGSVSDIICLCPLDEFQNDYAMVITLADHTVDCFAV